MEDQEDHQLARLYDYTKFHIGIYLSFAAGIAGLLGAKETQTILAKLVSTAASEFYVSLLFMMLAGVCGGIVASNTIECKTFDQFWNQPQGLRIIPWRGIEGRRWAALEHLCFWIGLGALSYAVVLKFPRVVFDNC